MLVFLKVKNRKKLLAGFLLCALLITLAGTVFAKSTYGDYIFQNKNTYGIPEINTNAEVDSNGTMTIRQKWVFDDKYTDGTEHYIVFNKGSLKGAKLKDFQVYQNGQALEEVSWDVGGSFEEKAGKFGFNETMFDTELCFGIGEKRSDNTFEITYKVENAIEKTKDGAYFLHWKFINDNLSDPVGKIRLELTFPNKVLKIYGFGYEGLVAMADDKANTVVYENGPDRPLREDNQLIALVEVEGPFASFRDRDQNRLDLYTEAFEDSSYNIDDLDKENNLLSERDLAKQIEKDGTYNVSANDGPSIVLIIIFSLFFPLIVIIILVTALSKNKVKTNLSRAEKKDSYFRDNVSIEPNKMLGLLVQEGLTNLQTTILYYFVKWVNEDLIDLDKEEEERFLRKNKEFDVFYFKDPSEPMAYIEKIFYDFFLDEASFDGPSHLMKLTTDDLKKINYQDLNRDFSKYLKSDKAYEDIDHFIEKNKKKEFLNEAGKKELLQYYGMKNFLKDFTLMDEREIREVKLWSYHLELAALLGLAEKVQEQLKVYPEVYQDTGVRMNPYTASIILHSVNSSLTSAMASSGSGGFSSTGGGGGFSGGGSGGGTR